MHQRDDQERAETAHRLVVPGGNAPIAFDALEGALDGLASKVLYVHTFGATSRVLVQEGSFEARPLFTRYNRRRIDREILLRRSCLVYGHWRIVGCPSGGSIGPCDLRSLLWRQCLGASLPNNRSGGPVTGPGHIQPIPVAPAPYFKRIHYPKDLRTRTVDGRDVRIEPGMRIAISGIWSDLWQEYEATWATVRLLLDGAPLTRWSPSFIIADDAAACVQVWLPTALSSSSPAPSTPTMAPTQPHPTAVASAPLATLVPTPTTVSPHPTTVSTPTPAKSLPPSPTIGLTASPPAAETQPTVTVPPPAQETGGNFLSGLSPIWLAIWVIVGLMIGVALVYYIWTVFRN